MELRRCYEILDIKPPGSIEDLKEAYKDLAQVWHPDRFSHNPRLREKAEAKLKQINVAYEVLDKHIQQRQQMQTEYSDRQSYPSSTSSRYSSSDPSSTRDRATPPQDSTSKAYGYASYSTTRTKTQMNAMLLGVLLFFSPLAALLALVLLSTLIAKYPIAVLLGLSALVLLLYFRFARS